MEDSSLKAFSVAFICLICHSLNVPMSMSMRSQSLGKKKDALNVLTLVDL